MSDELLEHKSHQRQVISFLVKYIHRISTFRWALMNSLSLRVNCFPKMLPEEWTWLNHICLICSCLKRGWKPFHFWCSTTTMTQSQQLQSADHTEVKFSPLGTNQVSSDSRLFLFHSWCMKYDQETINTLLKLSKKSQRVKVSEHQFEWRKAVFLLFDYSASSVEQHLTATIFLPRKETPRKRKEVLLTPKSKDISWSNLFSHIQDPCSSQVPSSFSLQVKYLDIKNYVSA